MEYKIAVATSDGIHIDLHFGQTEVFTVYQVLDDNSYYQSESRRVCADNLPAYVRQPGCGGCSGGKARKNGRIEAIEDCRCVLCARCGAGTETELGKRHITSFVIEKPVNEALDKIVRYYAGSKERG